MSQWRATTEALPPEGAPVIARWPDGTTHRAILRYAPDAIIWEVDGEADGPPEMWRWPGREASGLLWAHLKRSAWHPLMGLAVSAAVGLVLPAAGLLLLALILLVWLVFALAQSLGEAVATRRGGASGQILGAVVSLGIMAALVAGWLAVLVHLWRMYA